MESGARALTGLHLDFSAVRPHDNPRNAQSQSMPSGFAASGLIGPVEAIKNAFQLLLRHADTGIRYRNSTEPLVFPA